MAGERLLARFPVLSKVGLGRQLSTSKTAISHMRTVSGSFGVESISEIDGGSLEI